MTISIAISQTAKPQSGSTVLYGPVPTALRARVGISAVNQGAAEDVAFVAISQSAEPAAPGADWIEYGRLLPPAGGVERTEKWLKPGDYVVVKSNNGDIAFRLDGVQEDNV